MLKKLKKKGKKKQDKSTDKPHEQTKAIQEVQTYLDLIQESSSCSNIFIVLDARSPVSTRYTTYESSVLPKLTFILNKIDLVPREAVYGWMNMLNQVAPTIAISATDNCSVLEKYIQTLPQTAKILLTGFPNVGKRTIMEQLKSVKDRVVLGPSWSWVVETPELVVMNCIEPTTGFVIPAAEELMMHCSIQTLMDACQITFFSDPDRLLDLFPGKTKRQRSLYFLDMIRDGILKFYAAPPGKLLKKPKMSEAQEMALRCAPKYETLTEPYLMLGRSSTNEMKPNLIRLFHKMSMKLKS